MSWCGPCNIMDSNYRAMYFNFENAEDRIGFFTCAEENIPQEITTALKYGALTCKPRFLVYVVSCVIDRQNLLIVLCDVRKVKRKKRLMVQTSQRSKMQLSASFHSSTIEREK